MSQNSRVKKQNVVTSSKPANFNCSTLLFPQVHVCSTGLLDLNLFRISDNWNLSLEDMKEEKR